MLRPTCTHCKQQKDLKDFQQRIEGKGHTSWCRACKNESKRKRGQVIKTLPKQIPATQWCSDCKTEKESKEFSLCCSKPNGINGICKICAVIRGTKYGQTRQGKYSAYRSGAKRRNLIWYLSIEDFTNLLNGTCAYCHQTPANGVDRINSDKDYTLDNSVPCCVMCNRMKLDYSKDVFVDHIKKIYSVLTSK